MRDVFDGIGSFFTEIAFVPFDFLAKLELQNWWVANVMSWFFIAILGVLLVYWINQLKIFDENNEEDKSSKAHSFLE